MTIPGGVHPLFAFGKYQHEIRRSLRFNSADSAYLSRTPASAGNRKTWTWAGWVKRVRLATAQETLFMGGSTASDTASMVMGFDSSDAFFVGGFLTNFVITTQVFRDTSAWYHFVVALDTTQGTATNTLKIYVNGSQITTFSTDNRATKTSSSVDLGINQAVEHRINVQTTGSFYGNHYLADIHFIDGQALTPTSFTETDATTGQLVPKAYTGSYGTNGFQLKFEDNSSNTASTLGKDTSGNGNNFSPSNFSVTAGAGNDSLVDVPTNGAQTDTGVGGEVRGNYCTWNPLSVTAGTFSQGNLEYVASSSWRRALGTFVVSTGKWYYEATLVSAPNSSRSSSSDYNCVGWSSIVFNDTNDPGGNTTALLLGDNGYYKNFTGSKTDAGALSNGDVVGIAVDLDANTFAFYKSGSSIASGTIGGTAGRELSPAILSYSNAYGVWNVNFGQRAFSAGPSGKAPSGYKALCTTNLPAPVVTKPNTVMDAVTYNGSSGTKTITMPGGFSPDLVWIKNRGQARWHSVFDQARGAYRRIFTNATDAEANNVGFNLNSFTSDGFTLLDTDRDTNSSAGDAYVAWCWKGIGDPNAASVTNTQGSITSTVRANATAGFSICTFTSPTGTGNFSVGHGLGVTPEMVIVKSRDAVGVWYVYHKSLATDYYLRLNGTNAATNDVAQWGAGMTSTVLGLRASYSTVPGATTVAYAFAPVVGYSNGFSYTGNGSADGPMVYLGFRPRFIIQKRTDSTGSWLLIDTARDPVNVARNELFANSSVAEYDNTSLLDVLSNGFKIRATFANMNASGGSFIGFAFAESPFNYSRAR